MGKRDLWIQEAVGKEGAYRASVRRRYGKKGFTSRGTIKASVVEKDAKKGGKVGKQARLAKTLRKLGKKKRRKRGTRKRRRRRRK